MDFLFDIIFGFVAGIFSLICPHYQLKKWQEILCIIFSVLLLISSIGCFAAGIIILTELQSFKTLGIILTTVGGSLLTIQCVAFAVLAGCKLKASTQKNSDNN
ncbi:MAG: hypothetical protein HFE46_00965 [Clostridia bacterium]|jgi:hypothetical protein|nr:hypothetical protein [Clostridia bacterium]